ncbi:MAG: hypothetical protein WCJ64_11825 [Rhodospirillaceae bacterium]
MRENLVDLIVSKLGREASIIPDLLHNIQGEWGAINLLASGIKTAVNNLPEASAADIDDEPTAEELWNKLGGSGFNSPIGRTYGATPDQMEVV